MMKFVHRISAFRYATQGEMLPRGYGIAWVEFHADRAVCLPVPLHIIASVVRTAWQKVRIWRAPDLLRAEYDRGHRDGHEAGYKSGSRHRVAMQAAVPLLAFTLDRVVSSEEFAADPHKFIGSPKENA
jgi:hypothetical protein